VKKSDESENPHYDDLIRELRELKQFIEGNGDVGERDKPLTPALDREVSRAADARSTSPKTRQPARVAARENTPDPHDVPVDDGPPTLREAVRRPRKDENTLQLDLLSLGSRDEVAGGHTAPRDADDLDADASAPSRAQASASPVETVEAVDEAPAQSVPQPSADADDEEEVDDEVLRFVLDLSDRILNAIEDRLVDYNGEVLPRELRDELHETIGEILYEWCER
jgi:hypothetical protein